MVKKKTEPQTAIIPTTTLITISNEVLTIQAKLIEQGGELLEGDLESLEKWQGAIEEKAENICHVLMRMETEAEYYEKLAKAARARAETLSKTDKRLRGYLASVMQATGTKSIKQTGGLFTISLVDGRASLGEVNKDRVPLKYIKTEVVDVIDTKQLKTDLEAEAAKPETERKEIPGASLEYGAPYLMIRS